MYGPKDEAVLAKAPDGKGIILTFDDGPSRVLSEMLDILETEKVQAMFFWQSRLLHPKRPWHRLIESGHKIGSHSIRHRNMARLDFNSQYTDIAASVTTIEELTGADVQYFRPPFGQYNQDTLAVCESLRLTPVMWTIASMDWELRDKPEQIIANVTENLQDGAIILLHELRQTLEALPELIQEIRRMGYQFTAL